MGSHYHDDVPGPIEITVKVNAPAEVVWRLITDIDGAPERISAIQSVERLDDLPEFGIGTRWRETRTMFGRTASEEMVVTEIEPGLSYLTEANNHGVQYLSRMQIEPTAPDACTLTMHFDAKTSGFLNKTLGALVGRMMMSTTKKVIKQDLDEIAIAAERK